MICNVLHVLKAFIYIKELLNVLNNVPKNITKTHSFINVKSVFFLVFNVNQIDNVLLVYMDFMIKLLIHVQLTALKQITLISQQKNVNHVSIPVNLVNLDQIIV